MNPASNLIDVVAAVIEDGGKVLACRRRPEKAAGGLWEFPGGKIEPGETREAALIRELWEELGVEILVSEHLISVERPDVGIRLVCLRARLAGSRPHQSTDHDQLAWLSLPELASVPWAPADLPAVHLLMRESGLDELKPAFASNSQQDLQAPE